MSFFKFDFFLLEHFRLQLLRGAVPFGREENRAHGRRPRPEAHVGCFKVRHLWQGGVHQAEQREAHGHGSWGPKTVPLRTVQQRIL